MISLPPRERARGLAGLVVAGCSNPQVLRPLDPAALFASSRHAPSVITTTVRCTRTSPGKNQVQSHTLARLSPGYRHALPPPPRGGGGGARSAGGVGGCEYRYVVRQGRRASPPPRQPLPPRAISTTVRYTGTNPGNSSLEPHPGARLLPPGIPTHSPAPTKLTPVLPAGPRPGRPPRSPPGRPGSSA